MESARLLAGIFEGYFRLRRAEPCHRHVHLRACSGLRRAGDGDDELAETSQFLESELENLEPMRLPRRRARCSHNAELLRYSLDLNALTEPLQELARALAVPLKSVLLAAHLRVLSMLTSEKTL